MAGRKVQFRREESMSDNRIDVSDSEKPNFTYEECEPIGISVISVKWSREHLRDATDNLHYMTL